MAAPLIAWAEIRKAKSRASSESCDVVQLVAVHAVPVNRTGKAS